MLGASVAAFAALLARKWREREPVKLFPFGLALIAAATFTLLQLVPIPEFLLRILSPGAAELFDLVLPGTGLWGEGNWRALSLDPPATSLEVLKFTSYALMFIVVVDYFNRQHRARQLLKIISISGFAVALIGMFSKLAFLKAVYGIYPVRPDVFFFSTFVNSNHLAGFLGLCALVSFGLALSSRHRKGRFLYGFFGVISAVGIFLSLSRGGIVAFLLGCIFLGIYAATRRVWKLRRVALVQAVVAGVLLIAGYLAYSKIVTEMKTLGDIGAVRTNDKFRGWEGTLPMIKDHPVAGIGRGAYATVYPRYKTAEGRYTYTHAENGVLQNMAEWGPIFGVLFLGAFGLVFFLGLRRARSSFAMGGCLAAVFAVAVHNLVDFNLELGGVALPFVAVLGVVSAGTFSRAAGPLRSEKRLRLPFLAASALVPVGILIGAGFGLYSWSHGLERGTGALAAADDPVGSEPCSKTRLGESACEMLQHHPADYLAPLAIGKTYLESRPRRLSRAAYWLSRAVYLNPGSADIHRLTGRALYLAGAENQALAEYRRGVECDPASLEATVSEIYRLSRNPYAAVRAAPEDPEIRLELARILHRRGSHPAAARAAGLALELDPTSIGALNLLGSIELSLGNPDEALRLARRTISLYPQNDAAYHLQGRAYFAMGKGDQGEESWRTGLEKTPGSTLLANRLGDYYLSLNRISDMEDIVSVFQQHAPMDRSSQAALNELVGRLYEAKGMFFEAGRAYRTASALVPGSVHYIYDVGRIEQRMGNWDAAERIFERLVREKFNPEAMKAHIEAIRSARQHDQNAAMWKAWIADRKQGQTNGR
jgi:tetratricopeptide (TPR) repeat protein